ncbi:MAG: DNA polymerase III subunit delta' [Anaerolineales bacterium]|nr:DNA polymerase III subunit delta' [Anaerolineales bacterium]
MNWDMLGHEWAVDLLKSHIAEDNLRHAYLLTGPNGLGKRTLALRFTQALNCTSPTDAGEPCQQCRNCKQIALGQYPDLSIVQAEEKSGKLVVDQVRELSHSLALAPYQSKYRVALLLHFEDANPNASNALLKTLEEPPPKVILMLTAANSDLLLPTVVSRCEILRLRPIPIEIISEQLQQRWQVEASKAELLAHLSDGCPGLALTYWQNPQALAQRSIWLDEHLALLADTRVSRFAYSEKLYKTKEKYIIIEILNVWLSFWRDVFIQTCDASVALVNFDKIEDIKMLANRYDVEVAYRCVSSLISTLRLLEKNINTRLALDNLLLDLP